MSVQEKMTAIADAIRAKTGGTEQLTLDGMAVAIAGIAAGGGDYTHEQMVALIERTISEFTIPAGTTKIGNYAFSHCGNLKITEIPDSITSIGDWAFYNTSTTASWLPDSVTSIGATAFQNCDMTEMSIPGGIAIGKTPFKACVNLQTFTFRGKPKSINSAGIFASNENLTTINCPWAEGEVANAPWGAANATINYNYTEE